MEVGAKEWDVFMLVPTGRGKVEMEITPSQYETTLQYIYKLSLNSPIPIKTTCAPQYTRIIAQQTKEGQSVFGRGCMAGNGFCFVSHMGEVFGCGFLPIVAGNVRQSSLKVIYQNRLYLPNCETTTNSRANAVYASSGLGVVAAVQEH